MFMKILILLFLVICPFSATNSNKLHGSLEKLSMISRVVNAASLQFQLKVQDPKFETIFSELIQLPMNNSIPIIYNNPDLNSLSKKMQMFSDNIGLLPQIDGKKLDLTEKGIQSLGGMSADIKFINSTIDDPSTHLLNKIDELIEKPEAVDAMNYVLVFENIIETLEFIKANDYDKTDAKEYHSYLTALKDDLKKKSFLEMNVYSKFDQQDKDLEELETFLKDVTKLKNLAKGYHDNFGTFQNLEKDMNVLKNDISGVKKAVNGVDNLEKLLEDLQLIGEVRKGSNDVYLRKFTAGFPNGLEDIDLLKDDFNSTLWKILLGAQLDMEATNKQFDILISAIPSIRKVEMEWKKVHEKSDSYKSLDIIMDFIRDTVATKNQIDKIKDIESYLDTVSGCAKLLKPIKTVPDFESFDYIGKYLGKFEKGLKSYRKHIKNIVSSPNYNSTFRIIDELVLLYKNIKKKASTEDSNTWGKIKKLDLPLLIQSFDSIRKELESVGDDTWFYKQEQVNLDAIPVVLTSFEGTEVVKALSCLPASVSIVEVGQILTFGSKIETIKESGKQFSTVKEHFDSIDKFKKMMDVEVANMKVSMRKKTSNPNLKMSETVSMKLGLGVQSLKDILNVKNHGEKLRMCMNPSDNILKEILKIPGASGVWTVDIKKNVSSMIADIQDIETRMKSDGKLKDLFGTFGAFSGVEGVQMADAGKVFREVSENLKSIGDDDSKNFAKDLDSLKDLNLDFAGHRSFLHDAFGTMTVIDSFFKTFEKSSVKQDKSINGKSSAQKTDGSLSVIWIILIIFLVIIVLLALWMFVVFLIRRNISKNFERNAIYWTFNGRDLCKLMKSGSDKDLKSLLKGGQLVNIYDESLETPLHIAVKMRNPKIIRMLLKYGANKENKDGDGKTAMDYLKSDKDLERNKELIKALTPNKVLVFIQKMFIPSSYSLTLPPPLDTRDFNIALKLDQKIVDDFFKIFPKLTNPKMPITHIIFRADSERIVNLDSFNDEEKIQFFRFLNADTIMTSDHWINRCLTRGNKALYEDYANRIVGFKYHKKTYTTVDLWKLIARKRKISPSHTHSIFYVNADDTTNQSILRSLSRYSRGFLETSETAANFLEANPDNKKSLFFIYKEPNEIQLFKNRFNIQNLEEVASVVSLDDFYDKFLSLNMEGGQGKNGEKKAISGRTEEQETE